MHEDNATPMTGRAQWDDQAGGNKTAQYSLLAATLMSVVLFAAWWLLHPPERHVALQRVSSDVTVEWQCVRGHRFEDRGSVVEIDCPLCEAEGHGHQRANIVVTYVCRVHGEQEAMIRLTRAPDGRERIAQISFRPRVWDPVRRRIRCPRCGRAMEPVRDAPLRGGG